MKPMYEYILKFDVQVRYLQNLLGTSFPWFFLLINFKGKKLATLNSYFRILTKIDKKNIDTIIFFSDTITKSVASLSIQQIFISFSL